MNSPRATLLQLPAGSSSLFFQAARRQQALVGQLSANYDRWGYVPVHTPLLDFAKPYQAIVPEQDSPKIYHLIGRDGEILMLRWDITLFLVKQIHSLLTDAPLPLRLSYADSILRHQDDLDISHNEFFQTGVELIGSPGPDGDLEILLLLAESLAVAGVDAAIHVGSAAVFRSAFGDLPAADQGLLTTAIGERDWASLGKELARLGAREAAALSDCFQSIAEASAIAHWKPPTRLPESVGAEIEKVVRLVGEAQKLAPSAHFRVDFSELGSQLYHSGVVFQAYAKDYATAIAMGGRYDRLLAQMGINQPAVGFSIMLSKINAHSHDAPLDAIASVAGEPGDFAARFLKAQAMRAQGKRVAL